MTGNGITLGSLFDGIGGFPFCAQIMGARPVWAAEINPFGVAVTHHRFPDMLHARISKQSKSTQSLTGRKLQKSILAFVSKMAAHTTL